MRGLSETIATRLYPAFFVAFSQASAMIIAITTNFTNGLCSLSDRFR
ncbi:MAG: hypothetical protein IVW54_09075 [Candidatus Binataceae bacterium]|nr:hypothetical protein [Candidatus Binataceae bacterium]